MGAETGPKIVELAKSKKRTKVGSGECFDLAVEALKNASSKTAYDFGEVTGDADYVWGTEIPLTSVQSGDVIQYRDYTLDKAQDIEPEYTFPDGSSITGNEKKTENLRRP